MEKLTDTFGGETAEGMILFDGKTDRSAGGARLSLCLSFTMDLYRLVPGLIPQRYRQKPIFRAGLSRAFFFRSPFAGTRVFSHTSFLG